MSIVIDASAVVAALIDDGGIGDWAKSELAEGGLIAPHHMPSEAANILRKAVLSGKISDDAAAMGHADLLELRVALFGYQRFAERAWELRHNVTAYDAWYVAMAERFEAPLVTLDRRLAAASGPRCEFRIPHD